ncbi:MAG TPA: hypothetical protein V6D20_17275, partial [Candidatus Obscuribacterales bacterium]
MVTKSHTYQAIWQDSQKINWQVSDLISPNLTFDFKRPFLPESIAQVADMPGLNRLEKLTLNHLRGYSYLHLFVLVEQFIIPMVLDQVKALGYDDIFATQSLLGFAEDESKHIHLFQSFAQAFEQGFGTPCEFIGPTPAIVAQILSHHPLAVLLLTLQFEWTTQSHYLESMRHNHEEDLDPRFCDLLKFHWLEEAQHTKLDVLLTYALIDRMLVSQVEGAIADYLTLLHLLHNALMQQVDLDVSNLERRLQRSIASP